MSDPNSFPEQRYSYAAVYAQLKEWAEEEVLCALDRKKHLLGYYDQNGKPIWELRLPLTMPTIPEQATLASYVETLPDEPAPYLMFLVQLGAAAVGYFEEEEPIAHKAIKKYMKRQKRGKAQISYLNTRGKSKAGSRLRLANTVAFFEEINDRLTDYIDAYEEPKRLIYSTTPQVWGLMFGADPPPPFEKKDPRLIKIPTQVQVPDFEELMRINRFIVKGRFTHFQPHHALPNMEKLYEDEAG